MALGQYRRHLQQMALGQYRRQHQQLALVLKAVHWKDSGLDFGLANNIAIESTTQAFGILPTNANWDFGLIGLEQLPLGEPSQRNGLDMGISRGRFRLGDTVDQRLLEKESFVPGRQECALFGRSLVDNNCLFQLLLQESNIFFQLFARMSPV